MIAFLLSWCPSLQLLELLESLLNIWRSAPTQFKTSNLRYSLLPGKRKYEIEDWAKLLDFQGTFKSSWTSPQWPPWGWKKVPYSWVLIDTIGRYSVDILVKYQSTRHRVSVNMSVYISRPSVGRHVSMSTDMLHVFKRGVNLSDESIPKPPIFPQSYPRYLTGVLLWVSCENSHFSLLLAIAWRCFVRRNFCDSATKIP